MTDPADKLALRRMLRARRRDHVAALADAGLLRPALDRIGERVVTLLPRTGVVTGYVAVRDEVDPAGMLEAAAAHGLSLALPHVTGRDAPLRFLAWQPHAPLYSGPFGLLQPADDAPEVTPDLILTPLVGFDAALARLGQGAGHYDRAFAHHPAARRIGLAWSVQQVAALPQETWDMPLDAVVTEDQLFIRKDRS